MSDTPKPDSPEEHNEMDRTAKLDHDPILQHLIKGVNMVGDVVLRERPDASSGLSITVVVNGMPITGYAISMREFARDYAEQLRAAYATFAQELGDTMHEYTDAILKANLNLPDKGVLPRFIHLKDARLGTPGPGTKVEWPLWRGRISEVSGFSIGHWSESEQSQD